MATTITIASQKGGVGKTTTAVNLAATLSLAGANVLLIDLDPQGNASSGVGFHRPPPEHTPLPGPKTSPLFLSTVIGGEPLTSFICTTRFENLDVLPSSEDLLRMDLVKEVQESAIPRFRAQMDALSAKYSYIIVDCPPSLLGLATIALNLSDSVLIPIQCEYYAMEGLSQILPMVHDLQRTTNPKLRIFGLLLTMYSDELELSHDVVAEVRGYFKDSVFRTIIPRDVVLAEAASHGLPAFHYEATSRGAWSYIELAKEVLTHERS